MNKPIARFNTYDFLASALPVFKVRIDSKGFERATMPPIHRSISPYMELYFAKNIVSKGKRARYCSVKSTEAAQKRTETHRKAKEQNTKTGRMNV